MPLIKNTKGEYEYQLPNSYLGGFIVDPLSERFSPQRRYYKVVSGQTQFLSPSQKNDPGVQRETQDEAYQRWVTSPIGNPYTKLISDWVTQQHRAGNKDANFQDSPWYQQYSDRNKQASANADFMASTAMKLTKLNHVVSTTPGDYDNLLGTELIPDGGGGGIDAAFGSAARKSLRSNVTDEQLLGMGFTQERVDYIRDVLNQAEQQFQTGNIQSAAKPPSIPKAIGQSLAGAQTPEGAKNVERVGQVAGAAGQIAMAPIKGLQETMQEPIPQNVQQTAQRGFAAFTEPFRRTALPALEEAGERIGAMGSQVLQAGGRRGTFNPFSRF